MSLAQARRRHAANKGAIAAARALWAAQDGLVALGELLEDAGGRVGEAGHRLLGTCGDVLDRRETR